MTNRIIPIPSGTSPDQQLAIMNKNFAELDAQETTQLFYDATTGLPSISIGVQQDKSSAIKVAKPGFDVTSTSAANLAFNSAQNVFKIVSSGTIDNVISGTLASNAVSTVSLAHGQTGIPAFLAFVGSLNSSLYPAGQYVGLPYLFPLISFPSWTGIGIWAAVRADATNLYFDVQNLTNVGRTSMGTWTFRYYILQETAT